MVTAYNDCNLITMLRLLEQIRQGSAKPYTLRQTQHTRRINKFDASTMKVIRGLDLSYSYKEIRYLQPELREGKYLVAALSDGGLILYNVQDRNVATYRMSDPIWTVAGEQNGGSGHRKAIQCVKWYPDDNKMFATCSADQKLKFWDCYRMTVVKEVTTEAGISVLDFSPVDGFQTQIATGLDIPKILLFDTRNPERASQELTHEELTSRTLSLSWSPMNSNLLASAGNDSKAFLWDIRKHTTPVLRIAFFDSCSSAELQNMESYLRPEAMFPVLAMKFVRNGTNLLTYSKDCVKLWNTVSGEDLRIDFGRLQEMYFPTPRSVQIDIIEDSDPPYLFLPANKSIHAHNLSTGVHLKAFGDHYAQITCCSYNSLNMELYSASLDGSVIVWKDDEEHSIRYTEEIGKVPASLFIGHPGYPRRHNPYRSHIPQDMEVSLPPGISRMERRNNVYAQQYVRIRQVIPDNQERHGFYIGEVDYEEV